MDIDVVVVAPGSVVDKTQADRPHTSAGKTAGSVILRVMVEPPTGMPGREATQGVRFGRSTRFLIGRRTPPHLRSPLRRGTSMPDHRPVLRLGWAHVGAADQSSGPPLRTSVVWRSHDDRLDAAMTKGVPIMRLSAAVALPIRLINLTTRGLVDLGLDDKASSRHRRLFSGRVGTRPGRLPASSVPRSSRPMSTVTSNQLSSTVSAPSGRARRWWSSARTAPQPRSWATASSASPRRGSPHRRLTSTPAHEQSCGWSARR